MILLDFVFKMGQNHYPQVFLEECKCIVKEKEVTRHITKDLGISFDEKKSNNEE